MLLSRALSPLIPVWGVFRIGFGALWIAGLLILMTQHPVLAIWGVAPLLYASYHTAAYALQRPEWPTKPRTILWHYLIPPWRYWRTVILMALLATLPFVVTGVVHECVPTATFGTLLLGPQAAVHLRWAEILNAILWTPWLGGHELGALYPPSRGYDAPRSFRRVRSLLGSYAVVIADTGLLEILSHTLRPRPAETLFLALITSMLCIVTAGLFMILATDHPPNYETRFIHFDMVPRSLRKRFHISPFQKG